MERRVIRGVRVDRKKFILISKTCKSEFKKMMVGFYKNRLYLVLIFHRC